MREEGGGDGRGRPDGEWVYEGKEGERARVETDG